MGKLLADNGNALRFLMTDDLYLLSSDLQPVAKPLTAGFPVTSIPETPVSLVQESVTPAAAPSRPDFAYLGDNNRYLLIVVREPQSEHIDKMHLEMLEKIMGAKGLELRDVAIVNLHHYPTAAFRDLKEFFSCSKLVLFGINPADVQLGPIGVNNPTQQENTRVLATYSLAEMADNVDKKRQFWGVMKDF